MGRGRLFAGTNPWMYEDPVATRAVNWEQARWKNQTRPRIIFGALLLWLVAFSAGASVGFNIGRALPQAVR